ncbi:hypothetical protein [Metabacillus fastidiosus]|uniref:hypothetical protein n=1 Tax=Metabacillus fastidiosus TaxID=1458 RepID=UPI003D2BC763
MLERGGSWSEIKTFMSQWEEIGNSISSIISWINHLPENMPTYTIQLLAKIYELLASTILYTPLFIFNNSIVKNTSLVFASLSILIVTTLTMIEGIKKMLKKQHTDIVKISKRYFLAIVGAGFSPFIFEKAFELINKLSKSITQIGSISISNFNAFSHGLVGTINMGFLETLYLLLFDIIVIALLIPIILQTGRRWWDLLCLASIAPLSLSAWVFDEHRHYFNKWWSHTKLLAQSQLIYSIYICLMGVFIFGTANINEGANLIGKLLVIAGGLTAMSNPPQFIKHKVDTGDDTLDMFKNMWKTSQKVSDTVTFKPTRLFFKKKNENKLKEIQKLRKKHGRRFVKELK